MIRRRTVVCSVSPACPVKKSTNKHYHTTVAARSPTDSCREVSRARAIDPVSFPKKRKQRTKTARAHPKKLKLTGPFAEPKQRDPTRNWCNDSRMTSTVRGSSERKLEGRGRTKLGPRHASVTVRGTPNGMPLLLTGPRRARTGLTFWRRMCAFFSKRGLCQSGLCKQPEPAFRFSLFSG